MGVLMKYMVWHGCTNEVYRVARLYKGSRGIQSYGCAADMTCSSSPSDGKYASVTRCGEV